MIIDVFPPTNPAPSADQLEALAYQLADRACISDIEAEAVAAPIGAGVLRWYDTRPMLDPRELADDFVERNRQAIGYALGRGLIMRHPTQPHLVRIIHRGTA